MRQDSYKKLRLREMNQFDTERTLRENIYDLEVENDRIQKNAERMKQNKIPDLVILRAVRQMEDNAAEASYMTSLIELDLNTYKFTEKSTILGREER